MRQNILLLMVAVLIALGLSELTLRWLKPEQPKLPEQAKTGWAVVPERIWTQYDSRLGWYHIPSKTATLDVKGRTLDVHINSAGFRGVREYQKEKPADVKRILVLGDSFPFGFGVSDDETFPALLESRGRNREVINLSVPGYGIDQMLVAYRLIGAAYSPDIVVVCIFPEDFWRATRSFADSGHAKPYFSLSRDGKLVLHNEPVPPQYQLNTNQFPELLEYGPPKSWLRQSALWRLSRKPLTKLAKNLKLIDPDTSDEWTLGRVILKELIAEIRQSGSRPVIFLMPSERWARNERKDSLLKSLYRFADQQHVEMVDPTREFFEAAKRSDITDYYIKDDWHWTPKGHALAADILERYLRKKE